MLEDTELMKGGQENDTTKEDKRHKAGQGYYFQRRESLNREWLLEHGNEEELPGLGIQKVSGIVLRQNHLKFSRQ